jgi:hypothetical protein
VRQCVSTTLVDIGPGDEMAECAAPGTVTIATEPITNGSFDDHRLEWDGAATQPEYHGNDLLGTERKSERVDDAIRRMRSPQQKLPTALGEQFEPAREGGKRQCGNHSVGCDQLDLHIRNGAKRAVFDNDAADLLRDSHRRQQRGEPKTAD